MVGKIVSAAADPLADYWIRIHGGPKAAAVWLTDQTGQQYTRLYVAGFRSRGVPASVRDLIVSDVVRRMVPDTALQAKLLDVLARPK